jgi:hypothetical protein
MRGIAVSRRSWTVIFPIVGVVIFCEAVYFGDLNLSKMDSTAHWHLACHEQQPVTTTIIESIIEYKPQYNHDPKRFFPSRDPH